MANKKLSICSFNCTGFKSRNYEYIRDLYSTHDILLLQETWLYEFQISDITKILPNSKCHLVSSMEAENVGRVGRPYGGCCIVWNSQLVMTFEPLPTRSSRLCAIVAKVHGLQFVIISVYMPVDDDSETNYEIYGDTLHEINAIVASHTDSTIVIAGDFNVDFRRRSRNQMLLSTFLEDDSLKCLTEHLNHGFTYTYESSGGHRSFIDHILITNSYFNHSKNFAVLNDAINLSPHLPLRFDLELNSELTVQTEEQTHCKINWESATAAQLADYQLLLVNELRNITIPDEVISCSNFFCDHHKDDIINIMNGLMEIMNYCARQTIPKMSVGRRGIPGWNEFVKPYREKSIFWHDLWKSAGCPQNGQLAQIRRQTRAKYHWAVKYVKKNKDEIVKYNTAHEMQKKSFTKFWEIIRKMKNSNISLPEVVDGNITKQDIADGFAGIYSELYNSIQDPEINQTKESVKQSINNKCAVGQCNNSHCHSVSSDLVKKAIKHLKAGKRDEVYDIYTNNIIHAPEQLSDKLASVITAMITHGCSDELFNSGSILPHPKNRQKSLSDSSNYRAISLCTIPSKLLDYIIMLLIGDSLQTSNMQFAYKPEYSTSLCTFLVLETIQYYRSRGSNVYALSLDASKAFDKVKYSKLFEQLQRKNICPLIVRLLMTMYLLNNATVKWKDTKSINFSINNGVKQGGVLSPILFSVYLDPLIKNIQDSRLGCFMGNLCANVFAYADDLIILTPTCSSMRHLIQICERYSNEFMLTFNPSKCALIVFADRGFDTSQIEIKLFADPVPIVDNFKHLGHNVSNKGNMANFENIIKDVKVKTNILCNEFFMLGHDAKALLFNSQNLSLYGCQLWNLEDRNMNLLCKTWRKCCRWLLKLHPQTHNNLLPGLMHTPPPDVIVKERILSFVVDGLNHPSFLISQFFRNSLISNSSYIVSNVNSIIDSFQFRYQEIFNLKRNDIKRRVTALQTSNDWRLELVTEILDVRDGLKATNLNYAELSEILNYVCTM